jgi:hypothetical protein
MLSPMTIPSVIYMAIFSYRSYALMRQEGFMYLQEVGGGCGDWMELAQDRESWRTLVNTVMNFRVP